MVSPTDGPPAEAYGRVSEPERYRLLHPAAIQLVEDLVRDHDVVIEEITDLDPQPARGPRVERSVVLEPASSRAARVAIAWTSFPGVYVRFGRWERRSYPSCGCDACDEDPAELVHQLRRDVEAVVDGRFREEVRGWVTPSMCVELWGDGWRSTRRASVPRGQPRQLRRGRRDWEPWPQRRTG